MTKEEALKYLEPVILHTPLEGYTLALKIAYNALEESIEQEKENDIEWCFYIGGNMNVDGGFITEISENELYRYYLDREMFEIMSFTD